MCGPLFLTIAGIGLLSVGTCLGFLTAALFATGAEPAPLAKAPYRTLLCHSTHVVSFEPPVLLLRNKSRWRLSGVLMA